MAFERIAYLEAVVGADITAFRRGMRDIRNELGIMSETMRGLSALGRTMTFTLTAPMIALGSFAVQAASEFDSAMRNVNAIAGLTEVQFQELTKEVLSFSAEIRSGPASAAEALYTTMQAGITEVTTAMKVMEVASFTAEAGLASIETTTEALIASFLAYGGVAMDLAEQERMLALHSDALTNLVVVGVGSMENFANAVGQVLPQAVAVDMSIQELYGDLAFLTQRGLSASKAATSMNAALTSLAKPTEAMQAAFTELGAKGVEDLIDKFGGVNAALKALIGTTDGTQAEIQALFNNIRGARAINLFANDIEGWDAALNEFNETLEGSTMRVWEEQMKSFRAQFDLMKSALQAAAIALGQQLMPILLPFIQRITDLAIGFTNLNPEFLRFITVAGMVVSAAGPLIWLFSSILNPIGLLVSGMAVLAGVFISKWDEIKAVVKSAVTDILGEEGLGKLTSIWSQLQDILFPEEDKQAIINEIEPLKITGSDFVTVKEGDTLWDIFLEGGYSNSWSWEEFKNLVGLDSPHLLTVGQIIEIPSNFASQFYASIASSFSATGVESALELDASGLVTFEGRIRPAERTGIVATVLGRLKEAFSLVKTEAMPLVDDMWTGIRDYIPMALGMIIGGPVGLAISLAPRIVSALGIDLARLPDLISASGIGGSIQAGIGTVIAMFSNAFSNPLEDAKAEAARQFDEMGVVDPSTSARVNLFEGLIKWIQGSLIGIVNAWNGVKEGASGVIDGIKGFIDGFVSTIDVENASKVADALGTIFGGLSAILGTVIETVTTLGGNLASNVLPDLGTMFGELVNLVTSVATGDWTGAGDAVKGFFSSLIEANVGAVAGLLETFGLDGVLDTWENFKTQLIRIWETITRRINIAVMDIKLKMAILVQDLAAGVKDSPLLQNLLGISSDQAQSTFLEMAGKVGDIRFDMGMLQFEEGFAQEINRQLSTGVFEPEIPLAIRTVMTPDDVEVSATPFLDQLVRQYTSGVMSPNTQQMVRDWLTEGVSQAIETGNFGSAHKMEFYRALFGGPGPNMLQTFMDENTFQGPSPDGLNPANEAFSKVFDISKAFETFNEQFGLKAPEIEERVRGLLGPETPIDTEVTGFASRVAAKASEIVGSFLGMTNDSRPHFKTLADSLSIQGGRIISELDKIKEAALAAGAAIGSIGSSIPESGPTAAGTPRFGGGDVEEGRLYTVGEHGPEAFVAPTDGMILPNRMLGGGQERPSVTNNEVHLHGIPDVDALAYELRRRGYLGG